MAACITDCSAGMVLGIQPVERAGVVAVHQALLEHGQGHALSTQCIEFGAGLRVVHDVFVQVVQTDFSQMFAHALAARTHGRAVQHHLAWLCAADHNLGRARQVVLKVHGLEVARLRRRRHQCGQCRICRHAGPGAEQPGEKGRRVHTVQLCCVGAMERDRSPPGRRRLQHPWRRVGLLGKLFFACLFEHHLSRLRTSSVRKQLLKT